MTEHEMMDIIVLDLRDFLERNFKTSCPLMSLGQIPASIHIDIAGERFSINITSREIRLNYKNIDDKIYLADPIYLEKIRRFIRTGFCRHRGGTVVVNNEGEITRWNVLG